MRTFTLVVALLCAPFLATAATQNQSIERRSESKQDTNSVINMNSFLLQALQEIETGNAPWGNSDIKTVGGWMARNACRPVSGMFDDFPVIGGALDESYVTQEDTAAFKRWKSAGNLSYGSSSTWITAYPLRLAKYSKMVVEVKDGRLTINNGGYVNSYQQYPNDFFAASYHHAVVARYVHCLLVGHILVTEAAQALPKTVQGDPQVEARNVFNAISSIAKKKLGTDGDDVLPGHMTVYYTKTLIDTYMNIDTLEHAKDRQSSPLPCFSRLSLVMNYSGPNLSCSFIRVEGQNVLVKGKKTLAAEAINGVKYTVSMARSNTRSKSSQRIGVVSQ